MYQPLQLEGKNMAWVLGGAQDIPSSSGGNDHPRDPTVPTLFYRPLYPIDMVICQNQVHQNNWEWWIYNIKY